MVTQKSYSRITLALDIIQKLTHGPYAGFHELHAVKHQIDLHDIITIKGSSDMELNCDHPQVPTDATNICLKAALLLKNEYCIASNVAITIEKHIPVMGGLAGGSSNAATTLMMLNEYWKLGLSISQLSVLGRKLGMDVPYFFIGKTAFDTESTGIFDPLPSTLEFAFVIVVPSFGISTKEAYGSLDYLALAKSCSATSAMKSAFVNNDRTGVVGSLHNDFELSVFKRHPELAAIKQTLLATGCCGAVMSGSGSTMLGIAPDLQHARLIQHSLPYHSFCAASLNNSCT